MAKEAVYNNFDNKVTLTFTDDGVVEDVSTASKIEVIIGGTTIDTIADSGAFDLANSNVGIVRLDFGSKAITAGAYSVRIVVYDIVNTNGIVWAHENGETKVSIKVI